MPMYPWGYPVPTQCTKCGRLFLGMMGGEYPGSLAGVHCVQQEPEDGLCGDCSLKEGRERRNQVIHEELVLQRQDFDFLVLSTPVDELYDYLAANPVAMQDISHRAFEQLVADILRNHGFVVELTPQTRDGGFDILACRSDAVTGSSSFFVECKKWDQSRRVGVGVVRQILGVTSQNQGTKGLVVTSSYFTAPAKALEKRFEYRLALKDYDDLVEWIRAISKKWGN